MPRALKAKKLTSITPGRDGSVFQLQIEDEGGKRACFSSRPTKRSSSPIGSTISWPMRKRSCSRDLPLPSHHPLRRRASAR